jgi:hypothetical protein
MHGVGQASSGVLLPIILAGSVALVCPQPLNVISYHFEGRACRITGSIIAIGPSVGEENTRNISEMILIDRRTQFCSKKSILSRGPYSKIMPIFWKRLAVCRSRAVRGICAQSGLRLGAHVKLCSPLSLMRPHVRSWPEQT